MRLRKSKTAGETLRKSKKEAVRARSHIKRRGNTQYIVYKNTMKQN